MLCFVVPNGCRGLAPGKYWVKLIDSDEYPVVQVKCSNGYMVLDYSSDNNIAEYFDTWTMWHTSYAGPTNDARVNWRDWYLPGDENTSFIISPDCNTCEPDHTRQIYPDNTTYWMTGTIFGM